MSIAALIVAAGRGTRAGGPEPKQWQPLAGARVIDHTLAAFERHPQVTEIVLVLHPEDMDRAPAFTARGITVCPGGTERAASVQLGLAAVTADKVLIHDAARPCVDRHVIDAVIEALATHAAAAPGLPVTDALWQGADGVVTGTQDREGLFAAQTPQGFDLSLLHI